MSPGECRRISFPSVLLQPLGHLSVFRINRLRAVEPLIIGHVWRVEARSSITFRFSGLNRAARCASRKLCRTSQSLAIGTGRASRQQVITVPRPLPTDCYSRPPDASFDRCDDVIKINQMSSFYDKPREFGYAIHGEDYGFDRSMRNRLNVRESERDCAVDPSW